LETSNEPFNKWFRNDVPCKGYSKKSGIYIFTDKECNILYIGKAAFDNLGSEIYGKFGAATQIIDQLPRFDKSPMAKWAPDKYVKALTAGDVYISAVCIKTIQFSSLVEVFLHVRCELNGGLPSLNKRIG
jgi:hypothetical protein